MHEDLFQPLMLAFAEVLAGRDDLRDIIGALETIHQGGRGGRAARGQAQRTGQGSAPAAR